MVDDLTSIESILYAIVLLTPGKVREPRLCRWDVRVEWSVVRDQCPSVHSPS